MGANSPHNSHPSLFLKLIHNLETHFETDAVDDSTDAETYNKWFLPIFLDRFSIEDGSPLAESGMVGAHVLNVSKNPDTSGAIIQQNRLLGYSLNSKFANSENAGTQTDFSYDKHADGVFLGFKPRIYIDESENRIGNNFAAGLSNVSYYSFTPTGQHTWLKFTNLTGTYLASNKGYYIDSDGNVDFTGPTDNDIGLDSTVPNDLVYIISHEIDHNNSTETHILTVVNDTPSGSPLTDGYYRILQPNHT